MGHQVFEIEAVRKRVLDLLRKEGRTMAAGSIALALGLPLWAVTAGLDSARTAGLAEFAPGAGWTAGNEVTAAAQRVVERSQADWFES